MNVEFAPVASQALLLCNLCFKLHESGTAVVSSTAAATLRQLVMFVVDKIVEEDRRLLLASVFRSITLPDRTTDHSAPERATRSPSSGSYACWETASVRTSCSSNISTRGLP